MDDLTLPSIVLLQHSLWLDNLDIIAPWAKGFNLGLFIIEKLVSDLFELLFFLLFGRLAHQLLLYQRLFAAELFDTDLGSVYRNGAAELLYPERSA